MNDEQAIRQLIARNEAVSAMLRRQMAAVELIMAERDRAEEKFPDQHLEQGTGPEVIPFSGYGLPPVHATEVDRVDTWTELGEADARGLAALTKAICQVAGTPENPDTWLKVILEEAFEYAEASDPGRVKAELVQLGAMVLRALEDILAAEGGGSVSVDAKERES